MSQVRILSGAQLDEVARGESCVLAIDFDIDLDDYRIGRIGDKDRRDGSAGYFLPANAGRFGFGDSDSHADQAPGDTSPSQSGPPHRQLGAGEGWLRETIAPPMSAGWR